MTTTTTVDVFERAAELLKRDGWTQNSFGQSGEPMCLVGAISVARSELALPPETVQWERAFSILYSLTFPEKLTEWNDDEGRTAQEVLYLLERGCQESIKEHADC
jgi:hypothetical protein